MRDYLNNRVADIMWDTVQSQLDNLVTVSNEMAKLSRDITVRVRYVYLIMLRKVWKRIKALIHNDDRLCNRHWATIGYIRGNNVEDGSFEDPRMSCNQAGMWVRARDERSTLYNKAYFGR